MLSLPAYEPIEQAPRDGTPVIVMCDSHPEFGEHLMGWSSKNGRWEGTVWTLMRRVSTWWDESQPQPTHFKRVS